MEMPVVYLLGWASEGIDPKPELALFKCVLYATGFIWSPKQKREVMGKGMVQEFSDFGLVSCQ